MDEKSTRSPTWRTIDRISWSLGICVKPSPPLWGGSDAKSRRPWLFYFYFSAKDNFQDIDRGQTNTTNEFSQTDKSLRHIIPNQIFPSSIRQQNMQCSCNMVHSYLTLCLRARDFIRRLFHHPWYGLWMKIKGPYHYKVTALGSCVKWP